jgi:hypothetical protein
MNSTITIREYHSRYPQTAEFPTLVQSGALGLMLERQERKAARKARRRALLQSALHWFPRRGAQTRRMMLPAAPKAALQA